MLEEILRGRGMTPYEAQLRTELLERLARAAKAASDAARVMTTPQIVQRFVTTSPFIPPRISRRSRQELRTAEQWRKLDVPAIYARAHAMLDKAVIVPSLGFKTSMSKISGTVCRLYGVSQVDLLSQRRDQHIARPRLIAMWLAKELTPMSFTQIGRLLGRRDRTTALSGVRRIQGLREADPAFADELDALKALLTGGVTE